MALDAAGLASAALWGAYITWREVLPAVRRSSANGNGAAGNKSVDFWRLQLRETVHEGLNAALAPKFDLQIALLTDMKNSIAEMNRGVLELVALERARRSGRLG